MQRGDFGQKTRITAASTTTIRTGLGSLMAIIVNKAVANGTITVYDSADASGTVIAEVTFPATLLANQAVFPYLCQVSNGITIVTTGTMDITVVWK